MLNKRINLTKSLTKSHSGLSIIQLISIIGILFIYNAAFAQVENLIGFNKDIMDLSIDPGDDFYAYACGKWLNSHKSPEGYGRFGYFNLAGKKIENDLILLLKGKKPYSHDINKYHSVFDLFYSGMDTNRMENEGISVLKKYFKQINNIHNLDELQDFITLMQLREIEPFFKIYKPRYWEFRGHNYLFLRQVKLGLHTKNLYRDNSKAAREARKKYKTFIAKILTLAGENPEIAKTYAQIVLEIESRLASKAMTEQELNNRDKCYNEFKKNKLNTLIPDFDWERYLIELGIPETEKVIVGQPDYFREIGRILRDYDVNTLRVYVKWRLIYESCQYLSSEFFNTFYQFKKDVSGWILYPTRESFIYQVINWELPSILGALYLDVYFPPEKQTKVNEIISHLKTALSRRIQNSNWASTHMKEWAIEKLNNMKFKIGGPKYNSAYDSLVINDDTFLEKVFAIREFNIRQHLSTINNVTDSQKWKVTSHSTNAWYSHGINEVTLSAGCINTFMGTETDNAWIYATLGSRICHEMSHGFDHTGQKFNKDGSQKGWWRRIKDWFSSDNKNYHKRTNLIRDYYSSFTVLDTFHINGEKTLNENIADLCGLNIAYDAFLLSQDGQDKYPVDGFTDKQRFFISYAQIWREVFQEETLIQSLSGWHAAPQYRTNGVVYNIDGFYKAFDISPNSERYRSKEQRIMIW